MMIEEEDDSFDSCFVSSFIFSTLRIMSTSTGFDEDARQSNDRDGCGGGGGGGVEVMSESAR
ncbi:hypothetical protein A2U01_0067020, partial [Trifolium medium]|nr:hypothetical protein [Trifolium medium]